MTYSARVVLLKRAPEPRRRVFVWRNWLRRIPEVIEQENCPLVLRRPRYYSYVSVGSRISTSLRVEVANCSAEAIHSYTWRHVSARPEGNGAFGTQPETGFAPGETCEESCFLPWRCRLALVIDFVQFADGSTWFSSKPGAVVRRAGVEAGAAAAARHLEALLARRGPDAMWAAVPRIHADVQAPAVAADNWGAHGFYVGVTNMCVRVGRLGSRAETSQILGLLRYHADGGMSA